ncbi:MAG: UDP-N-acetylmuramyl-tripeptide synthetase [bacterium]|nr:UDP-N-acetylmuramyl-tripeptide synthetase [bacterium]
MILKLKNLKHFLIACFAYWRYGRPARKLIVVGVTGTKGKSTTCRLVASVLEAGGYKVGMLSTVEFQIAEKRWSNDKKMTMLGLGQIQKMLRDMVHAGCQYVVVETSSEGILQYRHFGLHYDIAVFTNLGSEHSERHGGFENLKADKGKMFAGLDEPRKKLFGKIIEKIIIANTDDAQSAYFLNFKADQKWTFGLQKNNSNNNVFGQIIASDENGMDFSVNGKSYHLNIIGEFNVYNALAAIAVGQSIGMKEDKIASGLNAVRQVAGRMEFIDAGQSFKLVVDYAHEPMSLRALFETLRKLVAPKNGRVIGIIGSDGGGRDVSKRAKMGSVTGELADIVIITDVNCFDEDPATIAEMLAEGARAVGKKDQENLFVEIDRRRAIELACQMAGPNDVIAITAKGTEPCIVVANGVRIPWDDRQVAKEILKKLK